MTFVSPFLLFCSHRYRFVAGFVTELLLHGYRQPTRLLIELEARDMFDFKKLENGESGTYLARI